MLASTYLKRKALLAFIGGMIAMLLLLASLPVSFQPSSGHGSTRTFALNSGPYEISIRGLVPVICRVTVDEKIRPAGGLLVDLGQMTEFCNSANGYIVYVDHTPDVVGAVMIVDGKRVLLSPHSSTAIYQSNGPGNRTHKISLDLTNHAAPKGGIWFRIRAL